MPSSDTLPLASGTNAAPTAYAVGGMVRALCAVRLVVLVLAAGESLLSSGSGSVVLLALAAAPFSFVPALNWGTRGPAYFRNGVLLSADIVVTTTVLAALAGLPLMAAYAAATVALWGVTTGLRLTLLMAVPVVALLIPWARLGEGWEVATVGLVTAAVVGAMAWAGSALGASVRRHQRTALALSREREALAAAQERLRIARDLHDTVAGDLAGLTLMVQGLRSRLDAEGVSGRTAARVRAVDEAVRLAHRHTRGALDGLRLSSGDPVEDVTGLVRRWSEHTGVAAAVEVGGGLEAVHPRMVDDLCAVVRELLENVRKHAGASAVEVRVDVERDELVVTVDDDGRGIAGGDRPAGRYGLQGISERAESHGGRAAWGASELGGTRARVVLGAVGTSGATAVATIREVA